MIFRQWLKALSRRLQPVPISKRSGLCCSDCHAQIHRHDRYIITSARHRDCRDPKLVGQKSLATQVYEESARSSAMADALRATPLAPSGPIEYQDEIPL